MRLTSGNRFGSRNVANRVDDLFRKSYNSIDLTSDESSAKAFNILKSYTSPVETTNYNVTINALITVA